LKPVVARSTGLAVPDSASVAGNPMLILDSEQNIVFVGTKVDSGVDTHDATTHHT